MMKLSSCFRKNVKKIPPAFLHEGIFAPRVLILMTLGNKPRLFIFFAYSV